MGGGAINSSWVDKNLHVFFGRAKNKIEEKVRVYSQTVVRENKVKEVGQKNTPGVKCFFAKKPTYTPEYFFVLLLLPCFP